MTTLETEIENLKQQLADLAERVRLDAVAEEFLAASRSGPDDAHIERYYTKAEVAEILARASTKGDDERRRIAQLAADFNTRQSALIDIINATNVAYIHKRAREAMGTTPEQDLDRVEAVRADLGTALRLCLAAGLEKAHGIRQALDGAYGRDAAVMTDCLADVVSFMRQAMGRVAASLPMSTMVEYSDFLHRHGKL